MSQEEAAQAAGRDFAGEIGIIDLASYAVAKLLCGGFAFVLVFVRIFVRISANGCLGRFFASRARWRRRVVGSGTRGREHARSEVSDRMFDHAGVEIVDRTFAVAGSIYEASFLRRFVRVPVQPMRLTLTGLMQEAGGVFGCVTHLEFADVERIHLR